MKKTRRGVPNSLVVLLFFSMGLELLSEGLLQLEVSNIRALNFGFAIYIVLAIRVYKSMPGMPAWTTIIASIVFVIIYGVTLKNVSRESPEVFQSTLWTSGGLIVILLALVYYFSLLRNLPENDLTDYFPFWVNTALFTYFSFNLFLFSITNLIFTQTAPLTATLLWGYHNLNNVMKNVLFSVALIRIALVRGTSRAL